MEAAKERFAGANSLAVPYDDMWEVYPTLARDVTRYASLAKSKKTQTTYFLSVRILVKQVEEDERFSTLGRFLRDPASKRKRPEDLEQTLLAAFKASYERLVTSGLYSPGIAYDHAQNAVAVFRWLGSHRENYPMLPKVVQLRSVKRAGPRKGKEVEPPFEPMALSEIESILGSGFVRDLLAYDASFEVRRPFRTLGIRYLMSCLKHHPSSSTDALLSAFAGKAEVDAPTIKAVIEHCEAILRGCGAFAQKTISTWMGSCGSLFEFLGNLPSSRYPHYSRRYNNFKHVPVASTTLADIDFPETRGLSGTAKLRRSMDLVRDAAVNEVHRHVAFFNAMAPMREDRAQPGVTGERRQACSAIATVVRSELHSLRLTGKSQFLKSGIRTNEAAVARAMTALVDPETWRVAGAVELVPEVEKLSFEQVAQLVRAVIGATSAAVLAAKIVFCCETGWNRQPIEDIPSELFLLRLSDEAGIASGSFVSVFKKRAGHDVQALLEHSSTDGVRMENAMAVWEETERNRSWGDCDQRCMLGYTSPAYIVLELMRPLMEPLDELTNDEGIRSRFFKYLGWSRGVSWSQREVVTTFRSGPLSTPGVSFPSIRKTYLQLMLREVGSVDALRTFAGHSGTGVLLPHYLNSPNVRRELEQSTRFFQNAVQSLVASEVGDSLELDMSPEDHEWFYNLARASGVASAVGYGISVPVGGSPVFAFEPSDEQVRALLALRMSLDTEEKTANPTRWTLVGVPLKGFVTAILKKLESVGASRLIKRISTELAVDVRSGRVVLPPLNLQGAR